MPDATMTPRARAIADRIARGQTVAQIANDLGVTAAAVYATLKRHHIPLPGRKRRPNPLDPHATRPDWSHPSPELLQLARTLRAEIMAAWHSDV